MGFVYQTDELFVQRKLLSVTKQAANVLPFRKKHTLHIQLKKSYLNAIKLAQYQET